MIKKMAYSHDYGAFSGHRTTTISTCQIVISFSSSLLFSLVLPQAFYFMFKQLYDIRTQRHLWATTLTNLLRKWPLRHSTLRKWNRKMTNWINRLNDFLYLQLSAGFQSIYSNHWHDYANQISYSVGNTWSPWFIRIIIPILIEL